MLKTLIISALSISLLLASGFAMARSYAVEVIVFDRLGKETDEESESESEGEKEINREANAEAEAVAVEENIAEEQWIFSPDRVSEKLYNFAKLEEAYLQDKTSTHVVTLEDARVKLFESGYHVLATASWQQPTIAYEDAPLVRLDNGSVNTRLVGFVRVYATSLIYADVDLQLLPPLPSSESDQQSSPDSSVPIRDQVADADNDEEEQLQPRYFINERRRVKFKQTHYFDHPYFGAILSVWPVAEEKDTL